MQKLPCLDGIRAIAALSVLASHVCILRFGTLPRREWTDIALYSHLAVDTFIVLSGFSLGYSAATSRSDTYSKFIKRRCLRILPAYYGAMVITGLLWFALNCVLGDGRLMPFSAIASTALMLNDFFPEAGTYFSSTFWSIGIEFRLYFLFPTFLWVYRRHGALLTLLAGAVVSLVWLGFALFARQQFGSNLAYLCPWYAVLFVFGIIASQRLGQCAKTLYWAIGSATALLPLLWDSRITIARGWQPYLEALPTIDILTGLLVAALLLWLGDQSVSGRPSLPLRALGWKPLARVAAWSYSLYLLHYPLLKINNIVAGMFDFVGWSAIALQLIPTLFGCWLFSKAFERQFFKRPVTA